MIRRGSGHTTVGWWHVGGCSVSGVHPSLGRCRGSACARHAGSRGSKARVCARNRLVTPSDVRSHLSVSESRLNPLEKVIIRLVAKIGDT